MRKLKLLALASSLLAMVPPSLSDSTAMVSVVPPLCTAISARPCSSMRNTSTSSRCSRLASVRTPKAITVEVARVLPSSGIAMSAPAVALASATSAAKRLPMERRLGALTMPASKIVWFMRFSCLGLNAASLARVAGAGAAVGPTPAANLLRAARSLAGKSPARKALGTGPKRGQREHPCVVARVRRLSRKHGRQREFESVCAGGLMHSHRMANGHG